MGGAAHSCILIPRAFPLNCLGVTDLEAKCDELDLNESELVTVLIKEIVPAGPELCPTNCDEMSTFDDSSINGSSSSEAMPILCNAASPA